MRCLKLSVAALALIMTSGCSDLALRSLDELNASMGGPRSCTREAEYSYLTGTGYTYATGGYCNDWMGELDNYSDYTVKCTNRIGNYAANTIYAAPGENTGKRYIGAMNGYKLNVQCDAWARAPQVEQDYPDDGYSLISKMAEGEWYLQLRNNRPYARECEIMDEYDDVLYQGTISGQGAGRWIPYPETSVSFGCR